MSPEQPGAVLLGMRPRTYFSLFADALTAAVAAIGFLVVSETFDLVRLTETPSAIWRTIEASLPLGVAFLLIFHFLLDDWAAARQLDELSPMHPSPAGMRLYLDVLLAFAFYGAFLLARKSDGRLLVCLASIYFVGRLWSQLVAQQADNVLASYVADKFVLSHRWGVLSFLGLYFVGAMIHRAAEFTMSRGELWAFCLLYLFWLVADRGTKWRRLMRYASHLRDFDLDVSLTSMPDQVVEKRRRWPWQYVRSGLLDVTRGWHEAEMRSQAKLRREQEDREKERIAKEQLKWRKQGDERNQGDEQDEDE